MSEIVEINSEAGTANAYLAVSETGQGPGILLLHAWWGLTPFFKELANRLAAEGFTVLATDLYAGRTADTIEGANALIEQLNSEEGIKHVVAGLDYLLAHPAVDRGSVGAIGFSMGADYASGLSTMRPEVKAVVLFYGGTWNAEEYTKQTNAAFLAHFAENDEYEPLDSARELESALEASGNQSAFFVYPGTHHWFFENNRPEYDPESATLAWERTVQFLKEKLA